MPFADLLRDRDHALDLLHACAGGVAGDQASLLREVADALLAGQDKRRDAVAEMLAAGAFESAATALLPENATFLLSRGGDGTCLASVALPGGEDVTAEGASLALALVTALLAALIAHLPDPARERASAGTPAPARLH